MNSFEAFIQFILIGATDKVKKKDNRNVERKFSVADKIFEIKFY